MILFHSVATKDRSPASATQNAYCLVNGMDILKKYSLDCLPQEICGEFQNYEALCDKLEEIYRQVAASSITTSEEGVVIQLVQKDHPSLPDAVVSICQIMSIEYQALKMICETLKNSLQDDNIFERDYERFIQGFIKELRGASQGIDHGTLAHEFAFYCDLFSAAFSLVTKRQAKERQMYQDLLFNDQIKFLDQVLAQNEEKNNGRKYVGKIQFESVLTQK